MPSVKRKAIADETMKRRQKLLSDFDKACLTPQLRRKWLPDVVFAEVTSQKFHSNVSVQELNKVLAVSRGLELENLFNNKGLFRADIMINDPTLPGARRRKGYFYYVCNEEEYPSIEFGHW